MKSSYFFVPQKRFSLAVEAGNREKQLHVHWWGMLLCVFLAKPCTLIKGLNQTTGKQVINLGACISSLSAFARTVKYLTRVKSRYKGAKKKRPTPDPPPITLSSTHSFCPSAESLKNTSDRAWHCLAKSGWKTTWLNHRPIEAQRLPLIVWDSHYY